MCGIVGAYDVPRAAHMAAQMMKALQHRGQEAAGISSVANGRMYVHKGAGLVDEVFQRVSFDDVLPGVHAIGHLRYSTAGDGSPDEIQPFQMWNNGQAISLVYNGNITNAAELRRSLEARGSCFRTTTDTELFLHLIAQTPAEAEELFEDRLIRACQSVEGAYSLIALTADRLVALTDPYGFRPLVMGYWNAGVLAASETCALDLIGVPVRDRQTIPPGTVCAVGLEGTRIFRYVERPCARQCAFEQIYFSRPDSVVFGLTSDLVRERLGQHLAGHVRAAVDLVTPVPDSSNEMARACAEMLHVPFRFALIRNHYTGRTFITPSQLARQLGVKMKLNVVRELVEGKRILIVDDSLVRGTTARKVVALLRDAGATEVHLGIASPGVIHPCAWGIDTPTHTELMASHLTVDQIASNIGADSLTYITVEDLRFALKDPEGRSYCTTCFTGVAPVEGQLIPADRLRTDSAPV